MPSEPMVIASWLFSLEFGNKSYIGFLKIKTWATKNLQLLFSCEKLSSCYWLKFIADKYPTKRHKLPFCAISCKRHPINILWRLLRTKTKLEMPNWCQNCFVKVFRTFGTSNEYFWAFQPNCLWRLAVKHFRVQNKNRCLTLKIINRNVNMNLCSFENFCIFLEKPRFK